jgi:hypothetical protein
MDKHLASEDGSAAAEPSTALNCCMDKHLTSEDGSAPGEPSPVFNAEAAGSGAEKARIELLHEGVTESIIGAFYDVYNTFGYGFLESPYCGALLIELRRRGHRVGREIPVPVLYKGVQVATYRIDFLEMA